MPGIVVWAEAEDGYYFISSTLYHSWEVQVTGKSLTENMLDDPLESPDKLLSAVDVQTSSK